MISVNMISLLFATLLWILSYEYIIWWSYSLRRTFSAFTVNQMDNWKQGKGSPSVFPGSSFFSGCLKPYSRALLGSPRLYSEFTVFLMNLKSILGEVTVDFFKKTKAPPVFCFGTELWQRASINSSHCAPSKRPARRSVTMPCGSSRWVPDRPLSIQECVCLSSAHGVSSFSSVLSFIFLGDYQGQSSIHVGGMKKD